MDNNSIVIGQILERIEKKTDEQSTELRDQSKMLVELKTNMTALIGNGQPGRIKNIEDDVSAIKRLSYMMMGAGVAIGGLVTWLFRIVRFMKH